MFLKHFALRVITNIVLLKVQTRHFDRDLSFEMLNFDRVSILSQNADIPRCVLKPSAHKPSENLGFLSLGLKT